MEYSESSEDDGKDEKSREAGGKKGVTHDASEEHIPRYLCHFVSNLKSGLEIR